MPERLFDSMVKGHSFEGACADLNIGKSTGFIWVKKYKQFADAKERGDMKALKFLESIAISNLLGIVPPQAKAKGAKNINTTMCIFLLKTRFHAIYGDKMKIEDSGNGKKPTGITLNYQKPKKKAVKK